MKKLIYILIWGVICIYGVFPATIFLLSFTGLSFNWDSPIIMLGFAVTLFVFFIPWMFDIKYLTKKVRG